MTPKQCRTARIALGWSTQELGIRANVGVATIRHFELERQEAREETILALKNVLAAAGIEFVGDANGKQGILFVEQAVHRRKLVLADMGTNQIRPVNSNDQNFQKEFMFEKVVYDQMTLVKDIMDWHFLCKFVVKNLPDFACKPFEAISTMIQIVIIMEWYQIPLRNIFDVICDRLSFQRFIGVASAGQVPSLTEISRFVDELNLRNMYYALVRQIDQQLIEVGISIRPGRLIDPVVVVGYEKNSVSTFQY